MRTIELDRLHYLYNLESSTNEELRELAALLRRHYMYSRARILGLELEAYDRTAVDTLAAQNPRIPK